MGAAESDVIAEPFGIRWGVVNGVCYPVKRSHDKGHDLSALMAEEPLPAAGTEVVVSAPVPKPSSASAAVPPPLPPPRR